MRNNDRVDAVRKIIFALPWNFAITFCVSFNSDHYPDTWQHHFNYLLNRIFVNKNPTLIKKKGQQPTYWYAAAEQSPQGHWHFHGQCHWATPNRCGTAPTDALFVPAQLYLERELRQISPRASVYIMPTTSGVGSPIYNTKWLTDHSPIIWEYAGFDTPAAQANFANITLPIGATTMLENTNPATGESPTAPDNSQSISLSLFD
jgi:hypothetical protein